MGSLALDANILVLLIVGLVERKAISAHKRSRQFTEVDFDLLLTFIGGFHRLIVTTSVLTEASNLLAHTNDAMRTRLLGALAVFVGTVEEERPRSAEVVKENAFTRLGLTDAGLMTCIRSGHALLTADLDLYLAAAELSASVHNFNHLRQQHLLS